MLCYLPCTHETSTVATNNNKIMTVWPLFFLYVIINGETSRNGSFLEKVQNVQRKWTMAYYGITVALHDSLSIYSRHQQTSLFKIYSLHSRSVDYESVAKFELWANNDRNLTVNLIPNHTTDLHWLKQESMPYLLHQLQGIHLIPQ